MSQAAYENILFTAKTTSSVPGMRKGELTPGMLNTVRKFTLQTILQDGLKCVIEKDFPKLRDEKDKQVQVEKDYDAYLETFVVGKPFIFSAKVPYTEVETGKETLEESAPASDEVPHTS
mmetsp:Transcript_22285/g.36891  ORF Transcript_22285/g.36891 Transcript_22285/m.36891 type:complete len:119 (-) Transcript_22285:485-841(-)